MNDDQFADPQYVDLENNVDFENNVDQEKENDEEVARDDALIAAYLDGELGAEEIELVRSRAASDEDFNRRIRDLQSAWDMLDYLPDTEVGNSFTQSTLEMAAVSAQQAGAMTDHSSPHRFDNIWTYLKPYRWFVLAIAMASLLGLGAGQLRVTAERFAELRVLSVISDLPGLRLNIAPTVANELAEMEEVRWLADKKFSNAILPDLPNQFLNREKWLEQLSSEQQAILFRNQNDAQRLNESEWEQLIELDKNLDADLNGKNIRIAMDVAAEVLATRTPAERAAFSSLRPDDQLEELRATIAFAAAEHQKHFLTEADEEALDEWCSSFVSDWFASRPKQGAVLILVNEPQQALDVDLMQELLSALSPDSRKLISNPNLRNEDRNFALAAWLQHIIAPKGFDAELIETYQQLSYKDKEEIELLPPEEAKSKLWRQYQRSVRK